MARSTLIIGNGRGMALDSEYFCLTTAMCGVWDSEDLTDVQKELIRSCLPVGCDTIEKCFSQDCQCQPTSYPPDCTWKKRKAF